MAIIKPMAKRKRSEHYVNNKEFLAALIKYQEDIEIARLQDKPKPVIPRYIGECFLKIPKEKCSINTNSIEEWDIFLTYMMLKKT